MDNKHALTDEQFMNKLQEENDNLNFQVQQFFISEAKKDKEIAQQEAQLDLLQYNYDECKKELVEEEEKNTKLRYKLMDAKCEIDNMTLGKYQDDERV